MSGYLRLKKVRTIPRLPLEGHLDLTYRCNNNCRHCWLRIPADSPEKHRELAIDQIRRIVDDAKNMGCNKWSVSGGEPMLRQDFFEILDYITRKSVFYSINTNGTFISPKIAQLLKRRGSTTVVLYGATADVHDHITRNPGSFAAAMQGFAYLRESGVTFTVQLIPMRDNFHQFDDMRKLAESLSRRWRIGASWLYLSACGDPERNREIKRQRLLPKDVVALDSPDLSYHELLEKEESNYRELEINQAKKDDRIFVPCIADKRDFHIDSYGGMTFCSFIKDPNLRYDLKKGDFKTCWQKFIPSLADKARGGKEYLDNCGPCKLRDNCKWCPVYGYLEHRRFSARVKYLCDIAKENKNFKKNWERNHRRYYQIGGITVQLDSDLPLDHATFSPKFKSFQKASPGKDRIIVRHHFALPDFDFKNFEKVYHKVPWMIFKKNDFWIYAGISSRKKQHLHQLIVANAEYTWIDIYNQSDTAFRRGKLDSLMLLPSDQFILAQVLANRKAAYFHASGAIFEGKGFLFLGHSGAGKSTIVKMLRAKAEILCDDRMIVRKWHDGFRIHGTWSHGEVSDVAPNSAPLKAILFLEKSRENRLVTIESKKLVVQHLLACLIKPFVTADWWEKMLSLVEDMSREIPCYGLKFDKSGKVDDVLKTL